MEGVTKNDSRASLHVSESRFDGWGHFPTTAELHCKLVTVDLMEALLLTGTTAERH